MPIKSRTLLHLLSCIPPAQVRTCLAGGQLLRMDWTLLKQLGLVASPLTNACDEFWTSLLSSLVALFGVTEIAPVFLLFDDCSLVRR